MGTFEFSSPDSLQRRVGQQWFACVLLSPEGIVTGEEFASAPHSELTRAARTVSAIGPRLLGGSLTGLGDVPVPWAG
jgi:hypothetical protein